LERIINDEVMMDLRSAEDPVALKARGRRRKALSISQKQVVIDFLTFLERFRSSEFQTREIGRIKRELLP
jgi:hypothetical protein